MGLSKFRQLIKLEAAGGIALLVATLFGLCLENSPFRTYYEVFLNYAFIMDWYPIQLKKTILFWINDGLMAIFFLKIGLEIKRELLEGGLSQKTQMILPAIAAIGGVVVPALIYTAFNYSDPVNMRGWAIPTAMDTAFTLGILSLFGSKIPISLKIFVMILSILDDIIAISVVAIFYAEELSHISILAALIILGLLVSINHAGVKRLGIYVILGVILWLFVLKTGVHTSIAGVLLAFTIPVEKNHQNESPLDRIERAINPWVAFVILPLFAFSNSGVYLQDITLEQLLRPLPLGIILGQCIGKQLGVFGACWLLIKYKIALLPIGTTWLQMYGVSLLCGIGFTMSLFIGALSFESGGPAYSNIVRTAILLGSLISAVIGVLILKFSQKKRVDC